MTETWTPPGNVTAGPASSSQFNEEVVGNLRWIKERLDLLGRGCVVRRTTAQTIATSTFTPVAFSASDLRDTDAYHSTLLNPTEITVPSGLGGWYEVIATVAWTQSSDGSRIIQALIDGSATIRLDRRGEQDGGGAGVVANAARLIKLDAGQTLEITVWQDRGSSLDITSAEASIRWVAEA